MLAFVLMYYNVAFETQHTTHNTHHTTQGVAAVLLPTSILPPCTVSECNHPDGTLKSHLDEVRAHAHMHICTCIFHMCNAHAIHIHIIWQRKIKIKNSEKHLCVSKDVYACACTVVFAWQHVNVLSKEGLHDACCMRVHYELNLQLPNSNWTLDSQRERVPLFPSYIRQTEHAPCAGLPGLSIPAGLDRRGLPVGLELDGPVWSDMNLLAVGWAVEELLSA